MGGGSYDRDVYTGTRRSSGFDYSDHSREAVGAEYASSALSPKNRFLQCLRKNGIVIDLDVTGSMGDWARTIYDKMPMFFGQILQQNYLHDISVSFAANGDANGDQYPVQVCDFAEGTDLDKMLAEIYLEGHGGGQHCETYELMAWFYANRCDLPEDGEHYFFFLADEGCYDNLKPSQVREIFGTTEVGPTKTKEVFEALKAKFGGNVFLIHKNYYDNATSPTNKAILAQWENLLGTDHVLTLQDPKAVMDVMLGIIARTSGARTQEEYLADMAERGQSKTRIKQVSKTLDRLDPDPEANQAKSASEGPDWL